MKRIFFEDEKGEKEKKKAVVFIDKVSTTIQTRSDKKNILRSQTKGNPLSLSAVRDSPGCFFCVKRKIT